MSSRTEPAAGAEIATGTLCELRPRREAVDIAQDASSKPGGCGRDGENGGGQAGGDAEALADQEFPCGSVYFRAGVLIRSSNRTLARGHRYRIESRNWPVIMKAGEAAVHARAVR